ncbi:MAG: M48 family metallopeptidase [Caldilineales bacterium]|nr:M48 family metallopeptidase [Caldilineales bacterium]MDW8317528.1 M48 family metallopeptidase [Anaerolineae bacterium]
MNVKIVRSARRTKTVQARVVNGELVVQAPAALSDAELAPIVEQLQRRLERRQARQDLSLSDEDLERLAQDLNRRYFNGQLRWQSIRWVTNQTRRFGSCTPGDGTIRISHRVASLPAFVRAYVVMHELAHLREPNHGLRFWKLVNRYPLTERARGYLMAIGLEDVEDAEEP